MKTIKTLLALILMASFVACSATPTRRTFKENWRDSKITSKVKWRMGRDKLVKAHNINVDTWRNVVTLTGLTTSEEEKTRAEEIAKNVKDVKEIRNYLDVAGPPEPKVVKENVPFAKPGGRYTKTEKIALPAIDKSTTTQTTPATTITEKDITKTEKPQNAVSHEIGKELAATSDKPTEETKDDVTLQAEQELKVLKAKKQNTPND